MIQNVVFRNGTIIDGSGRDPYSGDVLIRDNRIRAVGKFETPIGCRAIDCQGLTLAPGFIDSHSHSDLQVLDNRREKIEQGVTTEVVGNCGFSAFPSGSHRTQLQEFANGIFCGGEDWGWPSAKEYLGECQRRSALTHVLSLVGHGSLRVAVAGHRQGFLEARQIEEMERLLADSLSAGACGLSTGLMYAPGSSAASEELLRLCRVVARHDKIYATHMRSYTGQLLESIDEQLDLARGSGCRLQISHLQAAGRDNWDKQGRALEKIDQARSQGIDVAFDIYPYVAGSTVLTQYLPQSALDGGISSLLSRLADPQQRKAIAEQVRVERTNRWSDVLVTSVATKGNQNLVGQSLAAIAAARSQDPVEVIFDLVIQEQGRVNIVSFNQSEENLRQLLSHPLCLVISDGYYVHGKPHPRLYGAFPTLVGAISREKRWLTLSEAVHKVTGKPAERFQIKDRGLLSPGYLADIVVFDAPEVSSPASYEEPEQSPRGIRMVFREGRRLVPAEENCAP